MARKGGLGKGLDALFIDNDTEVSGALMQLRLAQVEPNKDQPREKFNEDALKELADSIREHGVLQPIIVRAVPGGMYQIIAGERRWRASRLAGLSELPAIVVDADDNHTVELALIENLQREDLSPLEEAQGYRMLMDSYNMTQEQVARRMGKSRPVVANALRLLNLPPQAQKRLEEGTISPGHARVLAGIEDPDRVLALLDEVTSKGLTVRQLEARAREAKGKPAGEGKEKAVAFSARDSAWGDPFYKEAELSLTDALSTKVRVRRSPGGGILEIEFYDKDQLRGLVEKLAGD